MSRSTFYHQRSHKKDQKIMKHIKDIFNQHHGNYGYRRITAVLRKEGIVINHKKVKRLMKVMENPSENVIVIIHIKEQSIRLQEMKSIGILMPINH